jgi:aryl-alcohol dehydrogenase-like predicted oxidoreductase
VSEECAESNRNRATIDTVVRIANEIGASPAQVALSWLSQRPGVIAPIFGARTLQQLKDNLGAADLALDSKVIAVLDAVSKPISGGYPYGAFGLGQRTRWVLDNNNNNNNNNNGIDPLTPF